MGIEDQIKSALAGHEQEAKGFIEQAGDFVDQATGGKFKDQVDQVQSFLEGQVAPASDAPAADETAVAPASDVASAVADAPLSEDPSI